MADEAQWLVQTREGRIFGPHPTSRILEFVERGVISGEEILAEHPSGQWHEISKNRIFYDRLLDALARGVKPLPLDKRTRELYDKGMPPGPARRSPDEEPTKLPSQEPTRLPSEEATRPPSEEATHPPSEEITVVPGQTRNKNSERKNNPKLETEILDRPAKTQAKPKPPPTLELKSPQEKKKFNWIHVAIAAAGAAIALSFIFDMGDSTSGGHVHLIAPGPGKNNYSDAQVKGALQKAISHFEKDTLQNYLMAQNELVRIIENAPRNAESLALLCMTYRELWPFAFQDFNDLSAISKVTQMVAHVDPVGTNGATCRVIQQLLNNRVQEAQSITDTILIQHPTATVFYEFKGDLLANQKDFVTAIPYAQKVQQLWSSWLKPYVSEAQYRSKLGQHAEAAQMYRQVLRSNPSHPKAKVLLGTIEFNHFNHPDLALELLKSGLEEESELDRSVNAQAFAALGGVYERMQKPREALKYAQKAYALRPIDDGIRALVIRLGGEQALEVIQSNDSELLALGDQYSREANPLAAQAQYKAAFEKNTKNATAALKAARSLWTLNDSIGAIEWVQKAIRSKPDYIEAYVTLADYYSQRFDFAAAVSILQKAQRINPKSYEVFRGWAQLEVRRNNFSAAVKAARQALSIYDTDIDSHILLVKANRALGDFREAYQWSARSIELDQGDPEAQSLYAEVLADFQGPESGMQYIRQLINTYPRVIEYKISLGRILKKEEKYADAIQILTAATNEQPNNKDAQILLAECYQLTDRLEDARASYLAAAALDPTDPTPLFYLGGLYLQFNKPLPSIEQYQRVLRLNSKYPRAHYFIGKAYLLMNEPAKALSEAEAEKKMNPNLADAYLLAGEARMDLKQYSQATIEFQRALKLRPQGAEIYVKLSKAYRLTGQPDLALSMLQMAALKESGYAEIYKERGAAYEMKNENAEAIESYQRYLQILPNAPDKSAIEGRIQLLGG